MLYFNLLPLEVSYREPPVQTYLLDDKGFINSIEPVNDIEMMVDQHLTAVFPEVTNHKFLSISHKIKLLF